MNNPLHLQLAELLLAGTGIAPHEAARLILELIEQAEELQLLKPSQGKLPIYRRIIKLGIECYRQERISVPFSLAVELYLKSRNHRRPRTRTEILQYCRRIQREDTRWEGLLVSEMSSKQCEETLTQIFKTPSTLRKAQRILQAIFTFSQRHGWCQENPVRAMDLPGLTEKRISPLPLSRIRTLLTIAQQPKHRPCAPALGLMLWAGIRPGEVERLTWSDINFADRVICIPPTHAKTGGARQVTLHAVLYEWLRRTSSFRLPDMLIIPQGWQRRWRQLRQDAGFQTWQPDVLRHTFASYHLKRFRDLRALQLEMGHGSLELLRTRYLNLQHISATDAARFWGKDPNHPPQCPPQ